ncbi:putative F-box/LRR-repeat protein, partial [Cucurbita argyrosperma subsp. argyrosperma]
MAGVDRLDMLPDVLLSMIVSSLPFKEAVRTSILSKRWVRIWQATKTIELEEVFFVGREPTDQQTRDARRRGFIEFCMNFLRLYQEPTVRKFSLSLSNPRGDGNGGFVDECIRFAVYRNVEDLELDFSNSAWIEDDDDGVQPESMFDLPPIVYGHKNLRSLKLYACGFRPAEFENLNALRHLSLGWLEVGIGEIRYFLKKCPLLESLNLKRCWNATHFEIWGNKDNLRLRRLAIEQCKFLNDWISVEAPNLTYFRYSGGVGSFRMDVNRCFEEADLSFEIDDEDDHSEIANLLYILLDSLYSAKVLSVCSSLLQVIPNGEEPIQMQAPLNVQHLTFSTSIHPNEFYGIAFLLNSCPHLSTLTLMLGEGSVLQEYEPPFALDVTRFWETNMTIMTCLSKSLEIVDARGFTGTPNEITFLAYLIHYGRRLRGVFVAVDSDDGFENTQIYTRKAQVLNTIKPASRNLQVHIY